MKKRRQATATTKGGLQLVGHRGARGLAPENTLAALDKALEHGVDEIEVDVRITSDNIPILCHDLWLRAPGKAPLRISQATYKQLHALRPDVPTLEQAIRHLKRRVPLQMEVKWGEPTEPVAQVLRAMLANGWKPDDFLIGSKKQRTLLALHRALPEIPKVVIEPYLSIRGVLRARQIGSKRLSMNYLGLWPGFIRSMHHRGYRVYAYTLNKAATAQRWERHGLAGVITDFPSDYDIRAEV